MWSSSVVLYYYCHSLNVTEYSIHKIMTRQRLSVHSKGSLREPTKQLRDSFQHHARNHLFTLLVAKQERIPEASPKILWEAFKKDRLCCFPLILWNEMQHILQASAK